MMTNQGASWSDADINRLARLYFSVPRPSIDEIASQLGRTKKAVWTEVSRLGRPSQAPSCGHAWDMSAMAGRGSFPPESASGSAVFARAAK
ncbi:hypothetical protein V1294_006041 [Bradyrhizobium sp. AZCC 1678]|uniref:hypothetical protein n=1 Tax=Bradyrhizobium sp. AZCC 1678 TaxID=3117030 RepID=UPI002FF01366